jgi:hypothetical protein
MITAPDLTGSSDLSWARAGVLVIATGILLALLTARLLAGLVRLAAVALRAVGLLVCLVAVLALCLVAVADPGCDGLEATRPAAPALLDPMSWPR